MGFGVLSLFSLKLNHETVPLFKGVKDKIFPERIPATLIVLCFFNSLLKLLTPLILEEAYSAISKAQTDRREYVLLITTVIISIALSQLLLIAYTLMLAVYRLNVKRELSARMLQRNFEYYRLQLQSDQISDKKNDFNMELAIKINTKLAVYLHNYYDSYLSLIFQCLNIIIIFIYLLYKLSFSLFFGVAIAGLVMYKSLKIAREINQIRFGNIGLRARRLKILQNFFNRITEFKMCWLDKWIYDKITDIQHQFQNGLRKIKMLDCWCVALWQFTSVGISSIVITAYFLIGLNQKVDKDSVFTPSTFVYLLGMLNFPLNALSWYIAGMKTAYRAIQEIKTDILTESGNRKIYNRIVETKQSFVISEPFKLNLEQPKLCGNSLIKHIILPKIEFPKSKIYSVQGVMAEAFLDKFIFLFEDKVKRAFVQQNGWLSASPLQTFRMQINATSLQNQEKFKIIRLMQLFKCGDIPLSTSTKSYSGGQKLRISLVRSFNLGDVILINTNLNSLDRKTQEKVKKSIQGLVKGVFSQFKQSYTVFLRDNEDLADFKLDLIEMNNQKVVMSLKQTKLTFNPYYIQRISLSEQVEKYLIQIDSAISLEKDKQSGQKKQYSTEKLKGIQELVKVEQKSMVSWSTFLLYYKSYKHLIFVISLVAVSCLSNYYNYFINTEIKLEQYSQHQVAKIILLTGLFAVGLFFRSFYFADANLDQSERICHNLNKNVIMNQLSFYASEEIINENNNSIYSKSKMICALSADTQTISDAFPFSTNIFANNITVVVSSIAIIMFQVPSSVLLIVLLVYYANDLNKSSHKKDEYLQISMKEKEVDVYRVLSQIENGKKYIVIHHKLNNYSQQLLKYQQQLNSVDWLSIKFKNYINLKYKIMMILFLFIAVVIYSLIHIFDIFGGGSRENNSSSGLALLIQYTIQLSNNLLFFVMSIWEIKGQAISLERVRPYLEQTETIKNRIESSYKIVQKIKKSSKSQDQLKSPLVNIQNLDFAYQANPDQLIFKNINFKINRGDRIMIKGSSGSGKTTLYKLLTSTYPKIINFVDKQVIVYFSPQHPLILPEAPTVLQNVDPFEAIQNQFQVKELLQKFNLQPKQLVEDLRYQQLIMINNIRAHLYGRKGIIIYDQPQIVIEESTLTYLIVTHHHEFQHNLSMCLQNKDLVKKKYSEGIDQQQLLRELN